MTTTVNGVAGLKELVGQHLGYSDCMEITQERVNLFADATWRPPVDPRRRGAGHRREPFGGPIPHGYLDPLARAGPRAPGDPRRRREDGRELRRREGAVPVAGAGGGQGRVGVELRRRHRHRRRLPGDDAVHLRVRGCPQPSLRNENLFRYYE